MERWSARLAAVMGAATIAVVAWIVSIPPLDEACFYGVDDVAFELAHAPGEASALFDPPAHVTLTAEKAAACRADALRLVKERSQLDWTAFVPITSLFLMFGLIAVRAHAGWTSVWPAVLLALLIAVTDVVETRQMLALMDAGFPSAFEMTPLEVSTRIKWLAHALAILLVAWAAWRSSNYLLAASCVPALVLIPLMCVDGSFAAYGGLSVLPAWLVLFSTCIWLVWRSYSRPAGGDASN
jgi:hypothetical protein